MNDMEQKAREFDDLNTIREALKAWGENMDERAEADRIIATLDNGLSEQGGKEEPVLTDDEIERVANAQGYVMHKTKATFANGMRYARDNGYLSPPTSSAIIDADIPEAIKAFGFIKDIGTRSTGTEFPVDRIHNMVKWANHGLAALAAQPSTKTSPHDKAE